MKIPTEVAKWFTKLYSETAYQNNIINYQFFTFYAFSEVKSTPIEAINMTLERSFKGLQNEFLEGPNRSLFDEVMSL